MNISKNTWFLNSLFLYSLTALFACCLYFSTVGFSFILPKVWSLLVSPKYLFVVGNAIVVYLVRESKLEGSQSERSYSGTETHEVCFCQRGTRSLRGQPTALEENEEERELEEMCLVEETASGNEEQEIKEKVCDDEEEVRELEEMSLVEETESGEEGREIEIKEEKLGNEEEGDGGEKEEEAIDDEEEEEVEGGLPAEELNRRVEEFIARVNRERWLEAKLLRYYNI